MTREIIHDLNKRSLSEATDISYSRLRKYSTGVVKDLSDKEKEKIYNYLINIANYFKI